MTTGIDAVGRPIRSAGASTPARDGTPAGTATSGRAPDARVETDSGNADAVGGIMRALAWLPRLAVLHLAWILGALIGGIILGVAPATVTLIAALEEREELPTAFGERVRWAVHRWRDELVPANRALAPFLVIGLGAGGNLLAAGAGFAPGWFVPWGLAPTAVIALWALLAVHHAAVLRVLRPDAGTATVWRAAAAGPVLLPLASIAWLITTGAAVAAAVVIVPIGALLGAGIVLATTWALILRVWEARMDPLTS